MNPLLILLIIVVVILATSFVVVQQGTISVITMFGKYRRILSPGLNFRIPLIEKVATNISIQNRSLEMEFQAITQDQANVYFKAMLVYSVLNADEETIKNVTLTDVENNYHKMPHPQFEMKTELRYQIQVKDICLELEALDIARHMRFRSSR